MAASAPLTYVDDLLTIETTTMVARKMYRIDLVVHGVATNFGDLARWSEETATDGDPALRRIDGQHIPLQMVMLSDEPAYDETAIDGTVLGREREAIAETSWCDEQVCHVARVTIQFHVSKHGKRRQSLGVADRVYPLCHS